MFEMYFFVHDTSFNRFRGQLKPPRRMLVSRIGTGTNRLLSLCWVGLEMFRKHSVEFKFSVEAWKSNFLSTAQDARSEGVEPKHARSAWV